MTLIQALATFGGAMALAGGLAGSAIGIANAASSGVATLSEEPGQLRNVIVLASLPMTQSFYGLIILIIILTVVLPKIAVAGAGAGIMVLGIGIMAGFAELFSAIFQGSVCASGIALLPKTKGRILTASMMLAVFVELIGVLGLVFTIMALSILKLM
ncbi:MAG: ATPase [Deltaproteobacteria bacterium]|nr:ATPase [Deltaproteobacteria bacterium]TFG93699.1 MAG: ATPase [Syntrophobacterales bacterium]